MQLTPFQWTEVIVHSRSNNEDDASLCELLLLLPPPLLPLTWWVQRVKGRIVVGI